MEYAQLGPTGLRVSRLCLGTMNFGPQTTEAASFEIMDRALAEGINFFDTANVYGWKKGEGWTEQILGRWFAQGGGRREKVVLATKVYGTMGDWPNQSRLSALHIVRACEASLKRLQTSTIDLYQMHHIDRGVRWEEVWQAMELLVAQGKVLYVGSSNFAGWHIAQAQETAKGRHFLGLASEQSVYNLMKRTVELEVLPACQAYGKAFLPYSPQAAGALGGKPKENEPGRRSYLRQNDAVDAFNALCETLGHEPADVALAWLAGRPGVTAPIVGPRTLAQFEANLAAVEIKLSEETLAELDRIFPGPGGPAPEAYAW
jgi:aryl-alcohol dehydrogenase-like predicted oxidoreductase